MSQRTRALAIWLMLWGVWTGVQQGRGLIEKPASKSLAQLTREYRSALWASLERRHIWSQLSSQGQSDVRRAVDAAAISLATTLTRGDDDFQLAQKFQEAQFSILEAVPQWQERSESERNALKAEIVQGGQTFVALVHVDREWGEKLNRVRRQIHIFSFGLGCLWFVSGAYLLGQGAIPAWIPWLAIVNIAWALIAYFFIEGSVFRTGASAIGAAVFPSREEASTRQFSVGLATLWNGIKQSVFPIFWSWLVISYCKTSPVETSRG